MGLLREPASQGDCGLRTHPSPGLRAPWLGIGLHAGGSQVQFPSRAHTPSMALDWVWKPVANLEYWKQ